MFRNLLNIYSQDEHPPSKRIKIVNLKKKIRVERRSVVHQQSYSTVDESCGFTIQEVHESFNVNGKNVIGHWDYVDGNAIPNTLPVISRTRLPIVNFSIEKRPQQIFSNEQEKELSEFARDASDYYNGLTSKDVRILAFVYGVCNQVDLPAGWRDKHEASFAWGSRFAKRHNLNLLIGSSTG